MCFHLGMQGLVDNNCKSDSISYVHSDKANQILEKTFTSTKGLEPSIPRSEVWCLIH